jgi:hypothetical protein
METKQIKIRVPKHGYIGELAKLCGCCRLTVTRALRQNWPGEKSDMVRKMYRTKYVEGK